MDQPVSVLTANIREALACGQLTGEGTQDVDGVAAIKLVSVRHTRLRASATAAGHPPTRRILTAPVTETTILWVNPATYLPVRVTLSMVVGAPLPTHIVGTDDIRWLAPTRANLALLTVPIPPGFRRVVAP